MATVTLATVWLNDAADPTDRVVVSAAELTRTAEVPGEVRRLAGGGFRLIRRPGTPRTWELSAPWASRAEVEWLTAHLGRTVTARDHRGHKLHGVYLDLPVTENGVTDQGGVELELREFSHTEEV